MAYVLGFFVADGNLALNPRGSRYISFTSCDRDLLYKIRSLLQSNHKIASRRRNENNKLAYCLQIGSKIIFNDLLKLGLKPNKSKVLKFPSIRKKYLSNFVRGFFDGDGNVTISEYHRSDRKSHRGRTILSGFISGSKKFLNDLREHLQKYASLGDGTLYFSNGGYRLFYSVNDSRKLYNFMYNNLSNNLFLERKKKIFESY